MPKAKMIRVATAKLPRQLYLYHISRQNLNFGKKTAMRMPHTRQELMKIGAERAVSNEFSAFIAAAVPFQFSSLLFIGRFSSDQYRDFWKAQEFHT